VISGVAAFGFWAETVAHKCEGMVSVHDMRDIDDFEFREHEYALVGYRTGLRFAMGDKVMVRVVAANLDKRQIDYAIVGLAPGRRKESSGREYTPGKGKSQGGPPKHMKHKKNKNKRH
jgi:ribonuclease R